MNKRILILQPYLAPYRIDVYNYLSKYLEIKILYWYNTAPEQNFNLKILKKKCLFKFEYLGNGIIIKNRVIKFDIFKQIVEYKPSLIICHEFGFFTLVSLFLSKFLRFKVVVNSDDNLEMQEGTTGIRKILRYICLQNSTGLISTTQLSLQYFQEHFPKLRNNSILYPIIQDESGLHKELINSLKISMKHVENYQLKGFKILLFVGRLHEAKGLDILINAFNNLTKFTGDIKLVIVGEGPDKKRIKEIVSSYNLVEKIIFTGRTDGIELYAWYNIGQILILPSRFEAFGAVVNEALISGNFVIASNKVGSEFLINSDNGLVFETENVDSLVTALKVLLGKISPIGEQIYIRKSKSVHSFISFTKNLKDFLLEKALN